VLLYIGYYRSQKEGAVPHSPRHCYPGSGFNPIRNEVIPIPVRYKEVREIRPNLYVFAKGGEREIVIYWYQSRGRVVAGEYAEKFYLILDAILRNRSDGALVRASLRTTAGMEEESIRMLAAFVSDIYPEIPKVIPD
jgi:EpsI family protein